MGTIKGKVTNKSDFIKKTETFGFALLLIETIDKYPQPVKFQFVNDNSKKLDFVKVDDVVTVSYNIRGNMWQGKCINNLEGWFIQKDEFNEKVDKVKEKLDMIEDKNDPDDLPF